MVKKSKLNKSLKISAFLVAGFCVLGGSFLLNHNSKSLADSLPTSTQNSTPEYFSANFDSQDLSTTGQFPLVLVDNNSKTLDLSFKTKDHNQDYGATDYKGPYLYGKEDASDSSWIGFDNFNFSLKVDGADVSISNFDRKCFATDQTTPQTNTQFTGSFTSQQFDLTVKLDTSASDAAAFPIQGEEKNLQTLTVNKEGVYEFTITYTYYSTSDNGRSWDESGSGSFTYTVLMFNHNTYLASGMDSPNLTANNFTSQSDIQNQPTFDHAYYYNYSSSNLPYISYDYTRYDAVITKIPVEQYGEEESLSIIYNTELGTRSFDSIKNNNVVEFAFNDGSKQASLYFKELGEYTISLTPIYTTASHIKYTLPKQINNKKVFVFGYQTFINGGRREFKSYENHTVKTSADVSMYLTNAKIDGKDFNQSTVEQFKQDTPSITFTEAITPVSTNQTPVIFLEKAYFRNAYRYKVTSATTSADGKTLTLSDGEAINSMTSTSEPGTYFVVFEYTFDDYYNNGRISTSQRFYQAFYFTVTKTNPEIEILTGDLKTVEDETFEFSENSQQKVTAKKFTNKAVYIKDILPKEDSYDKDIIYRIERVDFTNNFSQEVKHLQDFEAVNIKIGNETVKYRKIENNGTYTIKVFQNGDENSSHYDGTTFTIDNTAITDFHMQSVRLNSNSNFYTTAGGSEFKQITNQPIMFSWQPNKLSGASITAEIKRFPLIETEISSELMQTVLGSLATYGCVPTNVMLDLSKRVDWEPNLENGYRYTTSTSISSSFVKSSAGLYIVKLTDAAGNQRIEIVLLDTSKPNIVMKMSKDGAEAYEILDGNITISQDATLIWGPNKSFMVNFKEGFDDSNLENCLPDGEQENVKKAMSEFLSGKDGENGFYKKIQVANYEHIFAIPVNDDVLFNVDINESSSLSEQNYSQSGTSFKSGLNGTFDIHTSFSLFALQKTGTNELLKDESGKTVVLVPTANNLEYIRYNEDDISSPNFIENVEGVKINKNDSQYRDYQVVEYKVDEQQVSFIRQGSYTVYIRDQANTRGLNMDRTEAYMTYPSNWQMIAITSDSSRLGVSDDNTTGENVKWLKEAAYAIYDNGDTRNQFYEPTLKDSILYATFIPTITQDDSIIQVESVTYSYYPFITKKASAIDFTDSTKTNVNFYKTLSETAEFTQEIYNFEKENASENMHYIPLNVITTASGSKTAEGKYVITRKYKTEGESNGTKYVVGQYDFAVRNLTLIVDRENIISPSTIVEDNLTTYTYDPTPNDDDKSDIINIQTAGNFVILENTKNVENNLILKNENSPYSSYTIKVKVLGESEYKELTTFNPAYTSYPNGDKNFVIISLFEKETQKRGLTIEDIQLFKKDNNTENLFSDTITTGVFTKTTKTTSSTQSLVGNGILVSVFSGLKDSVEYPNYKLKSGSEFIQLNSGYTLYTKAFSGNIETNVNATTHVAEGLRGFDISPAFETNKLPVDVKIPAYKYTISSVKEVEVKEGTTIPNFETKNDPSLSKFHNSSSSEAEDANYNGTANNIIRAYKLLADVYYSSNGEDYSHIATTSNGSNIGNTEEKSGSGFAMLEAVGGGQTQFTEPVDGGQIQFTKPGKYIVIITQGSHLGVESDFKQNYAFAFNILKAEPEFDVYNSTGDSSGTTLGEDAAGNLYTNKSEIKAYWTDSTDEFIANIDKKQIKLTFNENEYNVEVDGENIVSAYPDIASALQYNYTSLTHLNVLTINLANLGIYENGKELKISMEFEHHDTGFYEVTSKTIKIDRTIYDQNDQTTVDSLYRSVQGSGLDAFDPTLSVETLRNDFKAESGVAEEKKEASYSEFVYDDRDNFYNLYYFPVKASFFNSLYNKIRDNAQNYGSQITSVYFKPVADIYAENYVPTTHINFIPSAYSQLNETTSFNSGGYYEVIERDYAGNLNIYIVYIYKDQSSGVVEIRDSQNRFKINDEGTETTEDSNLIEISGSDLETNRFNAYVGTGSVLQKVSYNNDKWNFFRIVSGQTSYTFVTSPRLSGSVRNLSTGEDMSFSQVLRLISATSKTTIYVYDRTYDSENPIKSYSFFLSRLDQNGESRLNAVRASSAKEGISIDLSSLPAGDIASSAQSLIYPISISVSIKDTAGEYKSEIRVDNDPNANLNTAGYDYRLNWSVHNGERGVLNINFVNGNLVISVNDQYNNQNTKFRYIIIDNYGQRKIVTQIFGESFEDGMTDYDYTSYTNGNQFYRSSNQVVYAFNPQIYKVIVKDYLTGATVDYLADQFVSLNNSLNRHEVVFNSLGSNIDKKYVIEIYDAEDEDAVTPLKFRYIHLYNTLPTIDDTRANNVKFIDESGEYIKDFLSGGQVNLFGRTYNYSSKTTFASIINISYTPSPLEIPYAAYVYKENANWAGFEPFESGYKLSGESGVYYFLFRYTTEDIFTQEYVMYRLEIIDPSANFFYVTVDGVMIEPEKEQFTNPDNSTVPIHYIVRLSYEARNSRFSIVGNEYQKVTTYEMGDPIWQGQVATQKYMVTNKVNGLYPEKVTPFSQEVAVTFIPVTLDPTNGTFAFIHESGKTTSLPADFSSVNIALSEENESEELKLLWRASNGIEENYIEPTIYKDGQLYETTLYYEGTGANKNAYILLSISGAYQLYLRDRAGNTQSFGTSDHLDINFLKDVHFTVTQSFVNGEETTEVETEAIDKAVYNLADSESVSLNLKNINLFYTTSSIGNGSGSIRVTRNGASYTGYAFENSSFRFSEIGYYKVWFEGVEAQSVFTPTSDNLDQPYELLNVRLRPRVYSFTIINPNDSRFAYEFSSFKDYEVERILKDDGVRTAVPEKYLGKTNLRSIYISSAEETSGAGTYEITINTHKNLTPGSLEDTKFTFKVLIRANVPPISVSLEEGGTTTGTITVNFNAENVFNSVGDCYITISGTGYRQDINSENAVSLGVQNVNINSSGTYFIQVYTQSGNLLYSYKVTRKEPLNGWAIAAIVIGSIVLVAGIIITIKLRKKIKIK